MIVSSKGQKVKGGEKHEKVVYSEGDYYRYVQHLFVHDGAYAKMGAKDQTRPKGRKIGVADSLASPLPSRLG